jgi:predicted DCC family thiol-disulfide oxidoreductase YuxK
MTASTENINTGTDAQEPLTLLYDGSCALCATEMEQLRRRATDGRLVFVDIAAADFDATAWGFELAALNEEMHAVRADGQVLRGLEAIRAAYDAAGIGWVFAPSGWAALKPWADRGYRLFARHRRGISAAARPFIDVLRGWQALRSAERMRACRQGDCDTRRRTR